MTQFLLLVWNSVPGCKLNEQLYRDLPLAQCHCQLYKADLPWKASCSSGREHT